MRRFRLRQGDILVRNQNATRALVDSVGELLCQLPVGRTAKSQANKYEAPWSLRESAPLSVFRPNPPEYSEDDTMSVLLGPGGDL